MADTGVVAGDFTQILTDMGRTVSYKVVTRTTSDMQGEETTTFAAASDQTVVFFLEENRYIWDKSGLLQCGDCYLICPTTLGAKRYDQFTISGQTFYIEKVTRRTVCGVDMADYCVCFKVA